MLKVVMVGTYCEHAYVRILAHAEGTATHYICADFIVLLFGIIALMSVTTLDRLLGLHELGCRVHICTDVLLFQRRLNH